MKEYDGRLWLDLVLALLQGFLASFIVGFLYTPKDVLGTPVGPVVGGIVMGVFWYKFRKPLRVLSLVALSLVGWLVYCLFFI